MTATLSPVISPTVMVVDDEPAVRRSLRWLMESVGLPVQTYASAQEFLAAYDPRRSGCIIMDVRMPGMGGLELQKRLQERGCRLPMIVLTAFADVPTAVRAMKSGAVHFFEKPVNNQLLLDQIHAALEDEERRVQAERQSREAEDRYLRLTRREAQVLDQVVTGFSSKEIGRHLGVSFKTVEAHRAKIMKKMEADNVPHLIRTFLSLPVERREALAARPEGWAPKDPDDVEETESDETAEL